jgi:cell division protein FtsB
MEFISHCIRTRQRILEGRATAGMVIILLVLSLLGWIYLTQASHVATTSRRVQELEVEKRRLQQRNMELRAEIAALESVNRLANRANELGFVEANLEDARFLVVDEAVPVQLVVESNASVVTRWMDNVTSQFYAWAGHSDGGIDGE